MAAIRAADVDDRSLVHGCCCDTMQEETADSGECTVPLMDTPTTTTTATAAEECNYHHHRHHHQATCCCVAGAGDGVKMALTPHGGGGSCSDCSLESSPPVSCRAHRLDVDRRNAQLLELQRQLHR